MTSTAFAPVSTDATDDGRTSKPITSLAIVGGGFMGAGIAESAALYEEFKRDEYAPPPLVKRMIAAGRLGRKSGRGFYDYATAG